MRRIAVFVLLGISASTAPASANPLIFVDRAKSSQEGKELCIRNVCFDREVSQSGIQIPIRGAGLLKYLGLEVYSAALYTSSDAAGPLEVIGKTPLKLVLHYHRSLSESLIRSSTERALRKSPFMNSSEFQEKLGQMYSYYRSVRKDDRYELLHLPGKGLSVSFNGKLLGIIHDDIFAQEYLGIWLSQNPLCDDLRDALTGRG